MSALEAKVTGQESVAAIIMNNDYNDDKPANSHQAMVVTDDDDDDELFELDIALLRGVGDGDGQEHRHDVHGAGDGAHALLANCLLPVSSVSKALPVTATAGSIMSSYYPGRNNSGRFFLTGGNGGGGRRTRLGRAAGDSGGYNSARFWFWSRGLETMGNFQR